MGPSVPWQECNTDSIGSDQLKLNSGHRGTAMSGRYMYLLYLLTDLSVQEDTYDYSVLSLACENPRY